MISGAVLLHKQESLKKLYLHRVLPIALLTAVFVLVQYLQNGVTYGQAFSLRQYLECLYSKGSLTEHWFLYAYLSFLIILPFLRALAKGLCGNAYYRYLFVLALVFGTLFPMWEALSDWTPTSLFLPVLTNIVFYPLMGYYMEKGGDTLLESRTLLLLADIVMFLLAVGNVFMNLHSLAADKRAVYTITFLPYFTCVLFWNFKLLGNHSRHASLWSFAGAGVFGTYLLEPQLRLLLNPLTEIAANQKVPYLANLFVLLILGTLGILLTNLAKKGMAVILPK